MTIQHDISLQQLNTFGIDVKAGHFASVESIDDLRSIIFSPTFQPLQKLVLGGGSNLLFTRDFEGLVVKIDIKGVEKIKEDEHYVWVKAGAGEVWHDLVKFAIAENLGGIENLSLIPGTVGAAPMQNIGAYGAEIKDTVESLEAVHVNSGAFRVFTNAECEFAYRHSIFKGALKEQYIIASVTFKLNKNPIFNTSYGDIQKTLEAMGIRQLSLKAVSDAVIQIRQSKLPDPVVVGNAGSFFKNPAIEPALFDSFKATFPAIPGYEQPDGKIKVPAGWLIEQCGWKGKTVGRVGVHENQALVLVNRGGAKGYEVKALATNIIESVREKFGVALSPEVNIV